MPQNRIYFISDTHLGEPGTRRSAREQENALIGFLRTLRDRADMLYIVGDLFDFWFEYRTAVPNVGARVIFELYNLVQAGVRVICLPGNHDIWLGSYLQEQVGLELPGGPVTVTHQGLRFYIGHGDEFRTDWKFRLSRAILKNAICIRLFRMVHPDLGDTLAQLVSKLSEAWLRNHAGPNRAPLLRGAQEQIDKGADIVICGHYHPPRHEPLGSGTLIVLGDWINDDSYAILENGVLKLETWK